LNRTLRILTITLGALLVLYIASELLIPIGADWYMKREIKKRYPQATDLSVSVKAFPAFRLFSRKYSSLTIEARGIELEGIDFESIRLFSIGYPGATFDAVIGLDEINNFFSIAGSYLENPRVTVQDSRIKVAGQVSLGYGQVNVSGTGTLVPRNGRDVFLVADNVTVEGVPSSGQATAAVRQYISDNPIFTVRKDLPFTITAIKAGQGKLTITGDSDIEKALEFN